MSELKVLNIINSINPKDGGAELLLVELFKHFQGYDKISYKIIGIKGDFFIDSNAYSLGCNKLYSFKTILKTIIFLRKQEFDILHVHLFPCSLYVALFLKLSVFKKVNHRVVIYTEHSTSNRRRNNLTGKIIDNWIYKRFSLIICISDATKSALRNHIKINCQMFTIYNGINITYRLNPYSSKINEKNYNLLYVGRLESVKNLPVVFQALEYLKKNNDLPFKMNVVGDGNQRDELKRIVNELDLNDVVIFHGYISNPGSFFDTADIFISNSKWEGFGLSVLEAMNRGIPVVCSNVEGLNEILPENYQYTSNSEDFLQLYSNILELLENSMVRSLVSDKLFEKSLNFCITKTAASYYNMYANQLNLD